MNISKGGTKGKYLKNHPMVPPLKNLAKIKKRSSLARTISTSRGAFFANWLTFEPRSPTKNFSLLKIAILKID